ncbi:MAG: NAD(P)/FAD-dependent oxidoreductase [Deltaproteobacteria bacterium]|nr:NAD(P)/FAD-dependent oxidoreductase [Deltaproteobacteria bacterium]
MTDYDAIVVGSGAGGLAAALRMSQQGVSVLLLEAAPSFGGYLNAFTRKGYSFDTGLHYLGKLAPGGSFRMLLELLEIDKEVSFIELNPHGFDRFSFPDFELRLCKGKAQYQERLLELFPHESKPIKRFFHTVDQLLKAFSDPKGPPKNIFDKIGYVVRHPVLMRHFRSTYQKMINGITRNPSLQAALSAHCGNSGLPPSRASAFLCLMLLDHYFDGAYYPKGGSAALRDAFVTGLRRRKAVLTAGAPVTRIERRGAEFCVSTKSGDQYTARAVVSNADPIITFRKLIDSALIPKPLAKKVARLRPSAGAFYAFIGTSLDLSATQLSDANIIHFDYMDVNRCFETLQERDETDPFSYYFLTSPSLKDPQGPHAPQGHHTLQIISGFGFGRHPFLPWTGTRSRQRGDAYDHLKNRLGMQLVRSAERYLPGLGDHLEYVEFATPLSSEYWVNSFQGANFGLEQAPDQFGAGRFYDCTTGIEGLFLVGSGTISGGVLPCMASGVWAASQILDFLNN